MAEKILTQETVREISRAVEFVRGELQTHLELGVDSNAKILMTETVIELLGTLESGASKTVLAQAVEKVLDIIGVLDQAAENLLDGSRREIEELLKTREQTDDSPQSIPDGLLSKIEHEVKRRREWNEIAREVQEGLEDERDKKKDRLGVLSNLLHFNAADNLTNTRREKTQLEATIEGTGRTVTRMIDDIARNEKAITTLLSYKQAIETLKTPPLHLLEAALPQVPSVNGNATIIK